MNRIVIVLGVAILALAAVTMFGSKQDIPPVWKYALLGEAVGMTFVPFIVTLIVLRPRPKLVGIAAAFFVSVVCSYLVRYYFILIDQGPRELYTVVTVIVAVVAPVATLMVARSVSRSPSSDGRSGDA
ncbi:hypothetical protein [Rehaibacterium terrae]|uniref:UDP-N-acetylmuramyl pentapeptide phosphotransferase/UDP-N-acetylglucosamine-1-phosphate transferase n=1 Tax=Rehaibacterium terrae TaxID=1341696 RepID=A0A7W7Y1P3_9GAMM|nr:hypothetical protein [Rehaibacterium terrae]MBB5016445.1 UDP-N-acetylmuramyl pentapeptide phosphotransferase/UDP-N-acetylglucosamine-1-phosphate transferase [Rehaibacterium terrae]